MSGYANNAPPLSPKVERRGVVQWSLAHRAVPEPEFTLTEAEARAEVDGWNDDRRIRRIFGAARLVRRVDGGEWETVS